MEAVFFLAPPPDEEAPALVGGDGSSSIIKNRKICSTLSNAHLLPAAFFLEVLEEEEEEFQLDFVFVFAFLFLFEVSQSSSSSRISLQLSSKISRGILRENNAGTWYLLQTPFLDSVRPLLTSKSSNSSVPFANKNVF